MSPLTRYRLLFALLALGAVADVATTYQARLSRPHYEQNPLAITLLHWGWGPLLLLLAALFAAGYLAGARALPRYSGLILTALAVVTAVRWTVVALAVLVA